MKTLLKCLGGKLTAEQDSRCHRPRMLVRWHSQAESAEAVGLFHIEQKDLPSVLRMLGHPWSWAGNDETKG